MGTTGQLILIHICTGGMVWLYLATIRSRMADWTYDVRMFTPLRFLLMPGCLAERAVWVRLQRAMAWVGLVMAAVVYIGAMIKILA